MEESEFDSYVKAGKIASEIKKFARDLIKPGMKLIDIAVAIDDKIEELGGEPAFPVNLSIDEVAAHFTPGLQEDKVAEGILKVDIGVHVDGFIADTAISLDLTGDHLHKEMIELNEAILKKIIRGVEPGVEVRKIGDLAQDTLEDWNKNNETSYSIIKSLSGHTLAKDTIHAGLTLSNYRNENKAILKDMAFAIEPFVTRGVGDIYEGKVGGIFVVRSDEKPRDRDSRKLLEFIKEKYSTRPFCLRWIEKAGFKRYRFAISNMLKQGILYEYPQLIEKSKAPVSQVENTVVFNGKKVVVSTA